MAVSQAWPTLDRRPETTSYQLDDLLESLDAGRIRKPFFQRGERWKDTHRLELFDSIHRGYPIGNLLLWKRRVEAGVVRFGDEEILAPARDDALLVVDGQQRLSTFVRALRSEPASGSRAIVYEFQTQAFRYKRQPEQQELPRPEWVPVATLFDVRRLMRWLNRARRDEALAEAAFEAGKRLREYRVPAYVVETDQVDALRRIFERINRASVRLSDAEVFNALYSDLQRTFDLSSVANDLGALGFGPLDQADVLRVLRAIADLPLDGDLPDFKPEAFESLQRTREALERTIGFLREVALVPHEKLLPHALPLAVLGRFFDRFPEPRERSRTLLRRWLWRGALAGEHTGAIVGLRQNVAAVHADDEEGSVQRLLALLPSGGKPAGPSDPGVTAREPFNLRNARSRAALCALAAREPLDIVDGSTLDLRAEIEAHKRVPMIEIVSEGDELGNALANRILHASVAPSELRRALATADDDTLARHVIPRDAIALLQGGRQREFLEARAAALAGVLEAFWDRQAEWGADDSSSIASMVTDD